MIRLIASDLDGTMVREGTTDINPEYYSTIRELYERGIRFCACTGRQYLSASRLLGPVKDLCYFIAEGGALLRDTREICYKAEFPRGVLGNIYAFCRSFPGGDLYAADTEYSYTETGTEGEIYRLLTDGYGFTTVNLPSFDELPEETVIKLALYNHSRIAAMEEAFTRLPESQKVDYIRSGVRWIDVCPPGVSKGSTLALLQKKLGISPEETLVFGDNRNDISMFCAAGTSCAVGNAAEEVKKAASRVIGDVREDGVLKELRKLL